MTIVSVDDHILARDLAVDAGRLLVRLRGELMADGAAPAEIKDRGDRAAHEFLVRRLRAERPQDGVLSEEDDPTDAGATSGHDDGRPDRLRTERVWIIDPLDGTREFSEAGRDDWAVHVAMCIGGAPVVGAVALPALGSVFSTADPPSVPPGRHQRIAVSRTRPPAEAYLIVAELEGELVPMGSAGAKAMAILRDEADIYPHSGGQYEWDSCAPAAVALAAGLSATRLDGSPLAYNNEDPYLPDVLFCRKDVVDRVLAATTQRREDDRTP